MFRVSLPAPEAAALAGGSDQFRPEPYRRSKNLLHSLMISPFKVGMKCAILKSNENDLYK